jgi:uncharacterized protein (DUF697 family)
MRIVTWIAVGAVVGLLAPTGARRLANDVVSRFGGAASGPPAAGVRPSLTDTSNRNR